MEIRTNPKKQTRDLANFLWGLSVGMRGQPDTDLVKAAAEWMLKLSHNICDQGYIGCIIKNCTADHK